MTCRDLSKSKVGRCYYCPIIDDNGNLVNDPVVLRIKRKRKWWISIADSDVLFICKRFSYLVITLMLKLLSLNVDIIASPRSKIISIDGKSFWSEIKS